MFDIRGSKQFRPRLSRVLLVVFTAVVFPASSQSRQPQPASTAVVPTRLGPVPAAVPRDVVIGGFHVSVTQGRDGLCVDVAVAGNRGAGSSGACGIDLTAVNRNWVLGAVGGRTFAAGVTQPGIAAVEVVLAPGDGQLVDVVDDTWLLPLRAEGDGEGVRVESVQWLQD